MDSCGVDSDSFFRADTRTVLEVCVLSLLFSLEVQTSKTTQILLDNSLVDGSTTVDRFTIVVRNPITGMSDTLLRLIKWIVLTSTASQPCS